MRIRHVVSGFRRARVRRAGPGGGGDPSDLLQIPRERFRVVNLEDDVELSGHFDLALCVEVAEHLSEPAGSRLVKLLTSVADVIVFSAAVPGQGGEGHITEQWPQYWQSLFAAEGYRFEDAVRWEFWDDEEIDWWYRQNMFVALLGNEWSPPVRAVIHPVLLEKKLRAIDDLYFGRVPLRTGAIVFGRALRNAVGRRLRRWQPPDR